MQCENCGHTTFIPGQMGDMIQTSGECPNCGVPYRHQPGGENVMPGEMEARGMPAPGEQDMGGNPLQEGIWGSIDGGWNNRMKRDESYASLRLAFGEEGFGSDDFDWDDDESDFDISQLGQGSQLHSRFIVSPEGKVYTSEGLGDPHSIFHEDIARHYGLPATERGIPGHSTGEAWSDGDLNFVTHETPFNAQQMAKILQGHYPEHTMPQIMPDRTTADDRWQGEIDKVRQEQGVGKYSPQERQFYGPSVQEAERAEKQRGRPYPYYDNPYINRGGSHNPSREMPYDSWQFETEQVIEPGPHTKEVNVPGEENPVILQHDNPEVLEQMVASSTKQSFLPALLLGGAAMAGRSLLSKGIVGTLTRGAVMRGMIGHGQQQPGAQVTVNNAAPASTGGGGMPAAAYSSVHEALSQSEHPSSIPMLNELEPDEVDPHEFKDGDHSGLDDRDINGEGGTDDPHGEDGIPVDGPVGQALEAALPALLHFYHSDESGADDPTIKALIDVLESEHPGTLDSEPTVDDLHTLDSLKTAKLSTGVLPVTPQPGTAPGQTLPAPGTQTLQNPVAQPQQQVNPVSQANCPNCGARVSPGQGACPQCGSGISVGQTPETAAAGGAVSPLSQPPVMGSPFTATKTAITDYRAHDEALRSLLDNPNLTEQQRQALNVAMAMRTNNMMLQNARERSWLSPPQPTMKAPAYERLSPEEAMSQIAPLPGDPGYQEGKRLAANGGPTNPEQFKAVKDYLVQHGAGPEELQDLIDNPGNYADILALIQGQGDRPQPDPDPGVPPPMPDPTQMGMDPAAMGGMPPGGGGMPMTGGVYAQWKQSAGWIPNPFPPTRPNQGDTNGVPNKGLGLETGGLAWWQHPEDSPEYQQGMLQEQQQKQRMQNPGWNNPTRMGASDSVTPPCPNCGSHTTALMSDEGDAQCSNCNHQWKTDFEKQTDTPPQTKAAADEHMHTNPVAVPAADQTAPDDFSQDQNPNIWTDQSGQPLQVGQEYEMYSARYDVPDTIRVTSIKPDSLEYVLTGVYGLEHRTAISRQEAEMDNLNFIPTDQAEPEDMQPQPAENPMAAPMDNTHEFALQAKVATPTALPEVCPRCGHFDDVWRHLGHCSHCNYRIPDEGGEVTDGHDNPAEWAHDMGIRGVDPDAAGLGPQRFGWNARLAGKKFTPMEQREFIDEPGVARNSEKLNLAGTHYVEEPEPDDFFIFGW